MYTTGVDLNNLFTKEEFGKVYKDLFIWVCLMSLLDSNEIEAVQTDVTEFSFRKGE